MGWEKLPYWLKGGLIGGIISIILLIIFLSITKVCIDPSPGCVPMITQLNLIQLNTYLIFICSIIIGFLIGAFVGFIIKKLKKK